MLRVGINGLGRIGRAIFRILQYTSGIEVSMVNDINPSGENLAYLLMHDSIYGNNVNPVYFEDGYLKGTAMCGMPIPAAKIFNEKNVDAVPWEVDVVVDASGVHENLIRARKLKDKILYYIVTNSPDEIDETIIMGVNEDTVDWDNVFIISSSICDANAFAPTVDFINSHYQVLSGSLITLHPWLSYQNLLDGPSRSYAYPGTIVDNFALGRSSVNALIPKITSCIEASERVIGYIKDRFFAHSFRVPTPAVSVANIQMKLYRKADRLTLINEFQEKEKIQKYDIVKNNFDPLTSTDFIGSKHSAIIDHRWTYAENNDLRLVVWYDNEWGYSCRVVDIINLIMEKIDIGEI